VFCASLADWLDNRVPPEWRIDLANLIDSTPELDWMLLTKRPKNFERLWPWKGLKIIPDNVWLGVTCEDQANFDRRWPLLRDTPAKIRFISNEPATGPITDIRQGDKPDWMTIGGASGTQTRMIEPAWAR
jgi:protein gp37